MNLKLPDIEPAVPVRGGPEAIERAGAAFQGAADKAGDVLLEMDKADLIVQHQEAALRTTKGLNDTLNAIKNEPYVSPKRVQELFGGKPPPEIALDEEVAAPGGQTVRQPRKVIPMHEVAPHLFARSSAVVGENAARAIKEDPWRAKFRKAQEVEVERARAEMMDWQRAQRLADYHVRTLAQLSQAAAQRNWALYETILDTAENTLGAPEREKLRAELPMLKTEAGILDRLRGASTVEELDALVDDIAANEVRSPDRPDAPFHAALPAEAQYKLTAQAQEKRDRIVRDAAEKAKAEKEAAYQSAADGLEDAIKLSIATGQPVSRFFDFPSVDSSKMDFDKFMALKHAYEGAMSPAKETDWAVYDWFARLSPEKLREVSVYAYRGKLADPEFKEIEGWWRAAREGKSKEAVIPDHVDNSIGHYVEFVLKTDPKKDPVEYRTKKARLGRQYLQWKVENPGKPFLYDDIGPLAVTMFSGDKKGKDSDLPTVNAVLGALGKTPTSVAIERVRKEIEADSALVDDAFRKYIDDRDADDDFRVLVYADVTVPSRLDVIKAQLRAQGLDPESRKNQIERSVQNHAPPESEDYSARVREEETKSRARSEANARAKAIEKEREQAEAAAAAAYAKLPAWQRHADSSAARAKQDDDDRVYRETYDRTYREVDERTRAGTGLSRPRTQFPSSEKIRAITKQHVEDTRADRHKAIDLQYASDREAFQTFIDAVTAGDPVARRMNEMNGYPVSLPGTWMQGYNFEMYRQLRREGKVF